MNKIKENNDNLSELQNAAIYALKNGFFNGSEANKLTMNSLINRGIVGRNLNGYYLINK